jgi:ribosomal protein L11 methyltransferase
VLDAADATRDESALDDAAALVAAAIPDAAAGVEMRGAEIVFWVPLERGEEAVLQARQAAAVLAAIGRPVDPARVQSRPAAPEGEWRDAWKRYFHTIRLTRQIVVVPSWDRHEPQPDDRVIHLDPGQAFGTGAHESTRLVLRILQDLADRGADPARVLDLGTGSGILALAAAALWPRAAVDAVDDDPLAVDTARENVAANQVDARVRVAGIDALAGASPFDLVLANIQADVLSALVGELAPRVAPGGWLALSGLLAEQAAPIAALYGERGLALEEIRPGEEDAAWSAVLLRRSAS